MGPNESAPRLPAAGPPKGQDAGAIVRAARLAAGLTLAELGRRCGYSASQVSRYERGVQPLTDITLLRRFSQVLAISPQAFGLTPPRGSRAGRHAVEPKDGDARARWPRVSREPRWEDGGGSRATPPHRSPPTAAAGHRGPGLPAGPGGLQAGVRPHQCPALSARSWRIFPRVHQRVVCLVGAGWLRFPGS